MPCPASREACIELQDQANVDVNVLFFLLWNATQGRAFNAADVTEIERRSAPGATWPWCRSATCAAP